MKYSSKGCLFETKGALPLCCSLCRNDLVISFSNISKHPPPPHPLYYLFVVGIKIVKNINSNHKKYFN